MAEHTPRTIERHTDVAVVGGSAAGLAAALQLGRQRLGVVVIDDGRPRNEAAGHMHGYLGHEGAAPADLIAIARDEVRRYGGEVLRGRKKPHACPAFGTRCTPEHPLGAPMVSAEGACAAYYRYGRH